MKKFGYLAPTYRLVEEIIRLKQSSGKLRRNLNNANEHYEGTIEAGIQTVNAYRQKLFSADGKIRALTHENAVFSNRDLSARQMSTHAIADAKDQLINTTNEALRNQHDRLRKEFLETSESIIESQLKLSKLTNDYREQAIEVERLSCQLSAARAVNCELARGNVAE